VGFRLLAVALDPSSLDDEVMGSRLDLHAVQPVLDDVDLADSASAPGAQVDRVRVDVAHDHFHTIDVHGPFATPRVVLDREAAGHRLRRLRRAVGRVATAGRGDSRRE
jgi:hypothetical protein